MLKSLASRGQRARQLLHHPEASFSPKNLSVRAYEVGESRSLAGAFAQLELASADLDFRIDVPPQWAE